MSLKRIRISWRAVVLADLCSLINLALHFGQIHHDQLNFAVEPRFPPDKPFIPGEIYATTLAEIVDHELNSRLWLAAQRSFHLGPAP